MPSVSATTVLPVSIDKAWATVGDLSTQSEWNTVHVGFPDGLPSPLVANARFKQTITNQGLPNDIAWTVTALEPERLLELTGKAPMNVTTRMRYELTTTADGTRLTIENEFNGAMIKLISGMLKKGAKAELDASLVKLNALLAQS